MEVDLEMSLLRNAGSWLKSKIRESWAGRQTMADNVQDVDRVVNYLAHKYKQKRVDIVGHSWGGMLAGSYAVAHPEEIGKLVLMNTALNFERLLEDTYQGDMEWARKTATTKLWPS